MPVLAVAVSGGLDSTALLHALARQARDLGASVVALHVDHGLQTVSAEWGRRIRRQCQRWGAAGLPVSARVHRVTQTPPAGASIEAWARKVRYAALAQMARDVGATHVWLAHHRRDQAETFLLQALRGAGPAGLAAMPTALWRDGLCWVRPWLHQPREAIAAYAARWRLSWVEDATNTDTRFDRNRLRCDLWPTLLAGFPHAETALGQSARQAARAAALMQEIGSQDLAGLRSTPDGGLDVAGWQALSATRRYAVLRAWCQTLGHPIPDSLLERLLLELPTARSGHRWPDGAGASLRLYRGTLRRWEDAPPADLPSGEVGLRLPYPGPGRHALPAWGGVLTVRAVSQGGIAAHWLTHAVLTTRQGGESFQFEPHSTARSLKKQYQARAIPAWQRHGPLLCAGPAQGGGVLFAPGLGVDARARATNGEPQWLPEWLPDATR